MHDVIIAGAGPGGSATASFLAQSGLDVLLLDKSDFPRDKTCGDGLTPRALSILDELDVLDKVNQKGYRIKEAIVYSPKGASVTTRVPKRDDLPPYMLVVPRLVLDDIVRERAVSTGAKFQGGVHVTNVEVLENGVQVQGRSGKKRYSAKGQMVVIAIGASVRLLHNMGILKSTPRMILAARTYYEDLQTQSGRFEFHFDGVPIPGYGWLFPLSDSSANIGTGILHLGRSGKRMATTTAKVALEQFLELPKMKVMLSKARQIGPVKGFPLRTDFAAAPTFGERILLVGEAAGLVNPLTGEGVDLALESGKIAAEHLAESFAAGDFTKSNLRRYDRKLRAKFQRMFTFNRRIRDWYLNEFLLNRLVYVANRRHELRNLFTDIVLGNTDAARAVSLKTMFQLVLTR
jgi:geranylgeranyl reductase family protein